MASKRKSTVPCMIPAKIVGIQDEHDAGLSVCPSPSAMDEPCSMDEATTRSPECQDEGGQLEEEDSYICVPCGFDSQDLNLFLDHVYSSHPDFRAEPSFHCLDCGVATRKFEGLALHNARFHLSSAATCLQVRMKDGRTCVEQNLAAGVGSTNSEICISKTPIMKMLRGKAEQKKFVSHSLDGAVPAFSSMDGSKMGEKKDIPSATRVPTIVHHSTTGKTGQFVNSSATIPTGKVPVTQVVHTWTNHQQSVPVTVSSLASPSTMPSVATKNLPKVMIPLSSIPTYNAAMDSSSFLKTSFNKFPYPTKAELCYLTVVTKYPEEQIKIWFTAQRLKQGISWSPEEIEDSRRKMFNTVIQGESLAHQAEPQFKHGSSHHSVPKKTFSNISHILQGGITGKSGVVVTQAVLPNGLQVGGGPVSLAITPKPQIVARAQMQAKPAAALIADKGSGVAVGVVGSSSSADCVFTDISQTKSAVKCISSGSNGNASTKNNGSVCENSDTGKSSSSTNRFSSSRKHVSKSSIRDGCSNATDMMSSLPRSHMLANSLLDSTFYKGKKSQEQLGILKQSFVRSPFPEQEEVERLTQITGLPVREVRKWFSDRRYHRRNMKGLRSGAGSNCGRRGIMNFTDGSTCGESPKNHQQSSDGPPPPLVCRSSPQSTQSLQDQASESTTTHHTDWDPHQVHLLEAYFKQNSSPAEEDLVQLQTQTMLSRQDIDGWFTERRTMAPCRRQTKEADVASEKDCSSNKNGGNCITREKTSMKPEKSSTFREHLEEEQTGLGPKIHPIKINLKVLREQEPQTIMLLPPPSTSIRGKKTAEQLHLLRKIFARTQWPSSEEYEKLVAQTGLPRPEVVRWFGDSRYVQKNGHLKWLQSYQSIPEEEEEEEEYGNCQTQIAGVRCLPQEKLVREKRCRPTGREEELELQAAATSIAVVPQGRQMEASKKAAAAAHVQVQGTVKVEHPKHPVGIQSQREHVLVGIQAQPALPSPQKCLSGAD